MTGRGGKIGVRIGVNEPSVMGTTQSGVPAPTAPQYNRDTPTAPQYNRDTPTAPQYNRDTPTAPQYNRDTPTMPGTGTGQGKKRARSQDNADDANDAKKPRRKRRSRCGKCIGCQEKKDCGICINCKDKPKFGGPNKRHAPCIKRQCQKLKYGPKKQTNKNVGKRVSVIKSGIAGGSEATGHLGGDQSVTQTGEEQIANPVRTSVTGDNEDSYSSDWSSTDVSENEDRGADVTGGQQHKQQHQQRQQQQQQVQKIGDLTVQLNHSIGRGSFGIVYKASYQGTPAAAKYLHHPVRDYESFKHEMETLQGLTHPNLVAYRAAAMCPGPQSRRRPILVMELMEKSLTQYLEEAENDLPVHLQVNVCLDIMFALAYLHSQQIVYGHLTSNNVLLVGTTAKVADFGISKLLDTQSSVTHPDLYLPPEVRVTDQFSEKSDIFSLGVLLVQILTREAPAPTQQQPAPLSEVDRRQQHIQKIASTHPLRDIALLCLKDTAMERPTAKKVLTKLTAVKYHPQYEDSLKQEREMAQREIAQLKEKLKSKEELILTQKNESHEQVKKLQQQVKKKEQEITSVQVLYGKQHQELQALRKELDDKVLDRDEQIQASEIELKKLLQQCKEKDVKISELEAWKKSIMDKIRSLASAAEHEVGY